VIGALSGRRELSPMIQARSPRSAWNLGREAKGLVQEVTEGFDHLELSVWIRVIDRSQQPVDGDIAGGLL
jgi:hypothetical protein